MVHQVGLRAREGGGRWIGTCWGVRLLPGSFDWYPPEELLPLLQTSYRHRRNIVKYFMHSTQCAQRAATTGLARSFPCFFSSTVGEYRGSEGRVILPVVYMPAIVSRDVRMARSPFSQRCMGGQPRREFGMRCMQKMR